MPQAGNSASMSRLRKKRGTASMLNNTRPLYKSSFLRS
jgi:hypothetical protein